MGAERRAGDRVPMADPQRATWLLAAALAAPTALLVGRRYGARDAARYVAGVAGATLVQHRAIGVALRLVGAEPCSPADLLTLSRASSAAALAGLIATGRRDRTGPAGWLGFLLVVLGATASDWLDGPLARRWGATRLGRALDIEADSWLTLWAAAAAVRWGDLPPLGLLPPLVRYARPFLALRAGRLPAGGGPWSGRVAGTAQMALICAALLPLRHHPSRRALVAIGLPVAAGQCVALVLLLRHDPPDRGALPAAARDRPLPGREDRTVRAGAF